MYSSFNPNKNLIGTSRALRVPLFLLSGFTGRWLPSFHFFANNSKTTGRRKLKFSHNVGIYQS